MRISSLCFSLVLFVGLSACNDEASQRVGQGDVFPIDELTQLMPSSGKALSLSGKTLVINFWASWCRPCRKEMPSLQKLSESINNERVLVIGVSVDEDRNLMQEFLLQQGIGFTNVQDAQKHLADSLLGIRVYPETFIVSPAGKIVRRVAGEREWNSQQVHDLLDAVESGTSADVKGWS